MSIVLYKQTYIVDMSHYRLYRYSSQDHQQIVYMFTIYYSRLINLCLHQSVAQLMGRALSGLFSRTKGELIGIIIPLTKGSEIILLILQKYQRRALRKQFQKSIKYFEVTGNCFKLISRNFLYFNALPDECMNAFVIGRVHNLSKQHSIPINDLEIGSLKTQFTRLLTIPLD